MKFTRCYACLLANVQLALNQDNNQQMVTGEYNELTNTMMIIIHTHSFISRMNRVSTDSAMTFSSN